MLSLSIPRVKRARWVQARIRDSRSLCLRIVPPRGRVLLRRDGDEHRHGQGVLGDDVEARDFGEGELELDGITSTTPCTPTPRRIPFPSVSFHVPPFAI